MRYLVTGAAGFIGSHMVARLKAQGNWVRATDIHHTPMRQQLYAQADEFVLADLREAHAHRVTLGIDRVVHLAADHGGAGYFYSDADMKAADNNLAIDRNVRRAALMLGVKRLFFASSACTYPVEIQSAGAEPLREEWLGRGEGEQLYGMAKRMSTLLFEGAREHGLDARCGVFHTIYGPFQDYEEPRAKFPTAICRKVIEAKSEQVDVRGAGREGRTVRLTSPPRVEIWGDGTQVRTFLYIEDALDRIQAVMDLPYEGPVNIGSDEEVTVQHCADWVAEAARVTPEWIYTNGPVGVAHRAADNTEWDRRYSRGELTSARDGFRALYAWMITAGHQPGDAGGFVHRDLNCWS